MEDNGHMAKMIRDAIEVCEKNRDSATSNALQEILYETERCRWFQNLNSSLTQSPPFCPCH